MMAFEFPRRWQVTVNIKDLLTGDGTREDAVRVGKEMARRLLDRMPEHLKDADLEEIIEDFESVDEAGRFALSAFNDTLDSLYDWADNRRVWLGLK